MLDEELDHLRFRGRGGECVVFCSLGVLEFGCSCFLSYPVLKWVYTDNYNQHIIKHQLVKTNIYPTEVKVRSGQPDNIESEEVKQNPPSLSNTACPQFPALNFSSALL